MAEPQNRQEQEGQRQVVLRKRQWKRELYSIVDRPWRCRHAVCAAVQRPINRKRCRTFKRTQSVCGTMPAALLRCNSQVKVKQRSHLCSSSTTSSSTSSSNNDSRKAVCFQSFEIGLQSACSSPATCRSTPAMWPTVRLLSHMR